MSIFVPNLERDYAKLTSSISGRNAIVTGAANGLGKGLVAELLQNGASVVAADIDMNGLNNLPKHPNLFIHHVNVTEYQSQLQVFQYARKVLGRIDNVYANAGIAKSPQYLSDISEDTEPDLKIIDINVKGVLYTTHLAVKAFREDKANNVARDQCLVLTGSFTSFLSTPSHPAPYAASKHAVWSLMRSLSTTGEVEGFRCNVVCPWFAPTAMVETYVRVLLAGIGMAKVEPIVRAFVIAGADPSLTGAGFVIDNQGLFIIPSTNIDSQCAVAFRERFVNVLKLQHAARKYRTPIRFAGTLLSAVGIVSSVAYALPYLKKVKLF